MFSHMALFGSYTWSFITFSIVVMDAIHFNLYKEWHPLWAESLHLQLDMHEVIFRGLNLGFHAVFFFSSNGSMSVEFIMPISMHWWQKIAIQNFTNLSAFIWIHRWNQTSIDYQSCKIFNCYHLCMHQQVLLLHRSHMIMSFSKIELTSKPTKTVHGSQFVNPCFICIGVLCNANVSIPFFVFLLASIIIFQNS